MLSAKSYKLSSSLIVLLLVFAGCIKNDLPYPKIQQNITSIGVEGESRAALIDSASMTVTLYLDETADIEALSFTSFSVTDGAVADPDLLEGVYDLSRPIVVSVSRYQTYQWLVRAEQHIERYFTIEGQIGETVIDAVGRRVIVSVPESADLSKLYVTSIKLGPEGITTMIPEISVGEYDFSRPVRVEVECHGRSEEWTIYVERTELVVSTEAFDVWSRVAWAYGSCPSDMKGGFQYRRADSETWTDVPQSEVTQTQGAFSCRIPHLEPLTEYVVRAGAGTDIGNEIHATTAATADIPDGGFDQWWLKNGKIWCPWNEDGIQYWDTGNTGAATLGQSNVLPTDHTPTGSGQAAELNTRFVGIGSVGKLAAGSIYTGSFVKVDGTNGILDFGRPWNLRPTKLKGYYQYKTAPINYVSTELADLRDRPDSCHIYVALTDWTAPFEIRTNPKNRNLFNKDADYVIGYGELVFGGTMDEYQPFEIEIEYRSTSRVPSYLLITAAASKYGDYFTGGAGAVLYVDEFSFDYDY
ncbi:MAG: PCMD domain-containing protein [Muribaculaceae bacterium]|nr:PCMD domain-containing protein [Muribaculaceae bacterium]